MLSGCGGLALTVGGGGGNGWQNICSRMNIPRWMGEL
jgi:hypothetical protein